MIFALAVVGVAICVLGAIREIAWIFFFGCGVTAAAPLLAFQRAIEAYGRSYQPKRVYDRSFLADVLGLSNVPHDPDGKNGGRDEDRDPPNAG